MNCAGSGFVPARGQHLEQLLGGADVTAAVAADVDDQPDRRVLLSEPEDSSMNPSDSGTRKVKIRRSQDVPMLVGRIRARSAPGSSVASSGIRRVGRPGRPRANRSRRTRSTVLVWSSRPEGGEPG